MKENLANILKNSILISDVISKYLNLTKKGKNFHAVCPFHDDKNPSLVVNNDKKIFTCFSCKESGDLITFVMKKENISFNNALIKLSKEYDIGSEYRPSLEKKANISKEELDFYEMNKQAAEIFQNNLLQEKNQKIKDYLSIRGITEKEIIEFGIGYSSSERTFLTDIMSNRDNIFDKNRDPKYIWSLDKLLTANLISLDNQNEYCDFFRNRIIFPIKNQFGNIVGFSGRTVNNDSIKYINSPTSIFFKKDKTFYNFNNVLKNNIEEIYITEGYFDVVLSHKMGIKNIVAIMGTSLTNFHFELLKKNKINTIILAMDNDNAGILSNIKLGFKYIEIFNNIMVLAKYDNKFKDLAELANKINKIEFNIILNNYLPFIEYYIEYIFNQNLTYAKKLKETNRIIEFIGKHSNFTWKNDYASLISKKTGFHVNDIIEKINSFASKNNNLNNNFSNSISKIEPKTNYVSNKNAEMEKSLLLIMSINPKIARFFMENVNQFFFCNDEYKDLFDVIKHFLLSNKDNNFTKEDIIGYIFNSKKNESIIDDINNLSRTIVDSNISRIEESGYSLIREILFNINKTLKTEYYDFFHNGSKEISSNKFNYEEELNEKKKRIDENEKNISDVIKIINELKKSNINR